MIENRKANIEQSERWVIIRKLIINLFRAVNGYKARSKRLIKLVLSGIVGFG